jgi:hypothetical protein
VAPILFIDMGIVAIRSTRVLYKQVLNMIKVTNEIDNGFHVLLARRGGMSGLNSTAYAISGRDTCEICRHEPITDRYSL